MRQVQLADVPGGDVDTDGVLTSAQAVREAAEKLRDAGDQAVGIWAAMPHSYDAPEAPTLHAAMHPVARDAATYAEAATAAASALTRYAEDVASVQSRMQVTAPLVQALASRITSTPVWRSDASITTQNATLHRQVQGAQEDLDTAADLCAAAIRRTLYGGYGSPPPYLSAPGPRSHSLLPRHLAALDDPRFNPFFFLHKTPADVNAWWKGLSPAAQHELITERPNLIGNRDGIPAAARDEANRIRLAAARAKVDDEIRGLEKRLAGDPQSSPLNPDYSGPQSPARPLLWDEAGRALLRDARARRGLIASIDDTIVRTNEASRQLITLRLNTATPRAAVAIGNIDTASHVAVLVGGTGTTVAGALGPLDHKAEQLLSTSHALAPDLKDSTAVVSWIDYDAPPELASATSPRRAVRGGASLASLADGIAQSTEVGTRRITLYGHSYGSIVVNEAAAAEGSPVSAVVVAGAPGVGAKSADSVERYSIIAPDDPIRHYPVIFGQTTLGLFPYDGASSLNSGPWQILDSMAVSHADGTTTTGISGHSQYLNNGTTSQHRIAQIISQQGAGIE